jgi:hypothetical protein
VRRRASQVTCPGGVAATVGAGVVEGGIMPRSVRVVGLGGSLRTGSTSRTALQTALDGAQAANAEPGLIWVRDLELPMYTPERAVPAVARELADTVHGSAALIWSTPTYHGSVSGLFKNAPDWLILLAERSAIPDEQASRTCGDSRRRAGTAGGQLDGIRRACPARLERSAGPAGRAVMADLRSRRPHRRRNDRRPAPRAGRRGSTGSAAVPGRRHLRLRRARPVPASGRRLARQPPALRRTLRGLIGGQPG